MRGNKFFAKKVYIVPGSAHRFRTEHDAKFYCQQRGIDFDTVEKYDSTKEYERWLYLQQEQRLGHISGLQRQVEYELIPEKSEQVYVRDRVTKDWIVQNEHYPTQKAAHARCKELGIQLASAQCAKKVEKVFKKSVIEKNAVYTADFVYVRDGVTIVEDCKSEITRKEADYVLRRKLMLHVHGIRVLET